jgi:starch synthase
VALIKSKVQNPLRVLCIGAEADPLVKVGGLGDVMGSLPRALCSLSQENGFESSVFSGLDVRLAIPLHPSIREKVKNSKTIGSFVIPHLDGPVPGSISQADIEGIPVYLIDGQPIAAGQTVYSIDTMRDGEKYTFFSLGVLEGIRKSGWQPDIIHAHDWHAALTAYWLYEHGREDPDFNRVRTILTVHNLPFMGGGTGPALNAFGIPPSDDPRLPEWSRDFPLALGLLGADKITTVSPTYGREILTPEFGSGLENFLKKRRSVISGILNGLDQQAWDPATDKALPAVFDRLHMDQRAADKRALLAEAGLKADSDAPLLIFIGRMDPQKGIDLALDALRALTDQPWQAIILGTGIPALEQACIQLEADYPDRVKAFIRFDAGLSRRMYAGADMILMPSRYEPCGLAQMIGMRYGCLPVARATGGLKDSIFDDPGSKENTGFLFKNSTPAELETTLRRAFQCYIDHPAWAALQDNAMRQDFSWTRSAKAYADLYLQLIADRDEAGIV